ncbi:MAG: hypothetical protein EOM15_06985 [Spirochaetia bacterium]|nr:hypothetical protein [Spirochaetia bacterium]
MYTTLLLYEAFELAMKQFLSEDEALLSWPKSRVSIAHCLASQLQRSLRKVLGLAQDTASPSFFSLPGNIKVDIYCRDADIIVHDRKERLLLAIIFSNDYLSKSQQEHLHQLQKRGCPLVLGAAFLPQKEYVLLYSPQQEHLEYYHYSKTDGTTSHLKQREVEYNTDDLQLLLPIKERRKRNKASEPDR